MAWIRTIDPQEASGELRAAYERIAGTRGGVAAVHRAQSLNPRALVSLGVGLEPDYEKTCGPTRPT